MWSSGLPKGRIFMSELHLLSTVEQLQRLIHESEGQVSSLNSVAVSAVVPKNSKRLQNLAFTVHLLSDQMRGLAQQLTFIAEAIRLLPPTGALVSPHWQLFPKRKKPHG